MTGRLSPAQWADYWQAGSVTTFMGRFGQNYDGVIRNFWDGVLARLPDHARIVDLATGNGALALLAVQYAQKNGKSFAVTGVDFAPTDPRETLSAHGYDDLLGKIEFRVGTRIEKTGLQTGGYDLACSQFGFEYADQDAALSEVDRLLKKSGSVFAAMLHVESSAIIAQAREGLEQVDACLASGLSDEVGRLLARLDEVRKRDIDPASDPACETLRASINRSTGVLHDAQARYRDPGQLAYYLANTMGLFNSERSGQLDLAQKQDRLSKTTDELKQYRLRMTDLMSSALSIDALADLESSFRTAGFRIDVSEPVHYEKQHFCHAIIASRR